MRVKMIFLAGCAGIVRYQVTQSTRLGPSNEIANVTILDTAYASGKEAHDRLTVSKSLNILVTDQISSSYFLAYVMYAYYDSRLSVLYITARLIFLLESA
jgi:hypothetical protein